jgi:tetratricopeptide (TPR) repeat protein
VTVGIATKTLAELYLSQGDTRRALEIYQELLRRNPSDQEVRQAVEHLGKRMARGYPLRNHGSGRGPLHGERIKVLQRWQNRIRLIRKRRKSE